MRVERKVLVLLMDNYRILSWNVRGLNSTNKQDAILDICSINKVGVGALLETKMRGNKVTDLMTHNLQIGIFIPAQQLKVEYYSFGGKFLYKLLFLKNLTSMCTV